MDLADRVVVVLDEPQNLINIGGVVRAMMNMGLAQLVLVRPAEFDPWRILGIAHRGEGVVEAIRIVDTLEEALRDSVFVLGTSARARTAQRNYGRPRDWAGPLLQRTAEGRVALVLGREDRGLSNEALDRCDGVAVIPTDPAYSSLNLAQAFLILAYEIRLAAEAEVAPLPVGKRTAGPATRAEMEWMFQALEAGLRRIEFFKGRQPETVMRTFRTLLSRAELDRHEAGLVRAFSFEIGNYIDRTGDASTPTMAENSPRGAPKPTSDGSIG